MLCIRSLALIYYSLQICTLEQLLSYPPNLHPLITTTLLSVFMNLAFLEPTCKWYHIVFVCLCLTYLTEHKVLIVHPCCRKWQDILLIHGRIILCVYLSVYLYRYTHTHTHTYIYLIHSSVDGHLDCFHILPAVNNAAINIGVHRSLRSCFHSLGIHPAIELLDPNLWNFFFFEIFSF